ncbi:hypothetical protein ES707_13109 [subsurface metagenome]
MPTVAITETEINPTYVEGHGGGYRALGPEVEINPTFFGEGGGGWNVFVETEINPTYELLTHDTQTLGKTKGFDFRGKGFRI